MITGIQVSSVKPLLQTPEQVTEALAKFHCMGADVLQLQWIDFSVTPQQIAHSVRHTGTQSVSTQDFYTVVTQNLDYFIELNRLCGSKWLCISRIPQEYKSAEGLVQFCRKLDELSEKIKSDELMLCFHPTAPDYTAIEQIQPIDFIMNHTQHPMHLCFDLYHIFKSGLNPVDLLYQYAGRVCMVHFKDYQTLSDGSTQLVPAGQGEINWNDAIRACLKTGVTYGFVEQESWQKDPFECLQEAFDWLNSQIKAIEG